MAHHHAGAKTEPLENVQAGDIREQMDRILKSPMFRNSQRLQRFLQFAVECVLDGTTDQLKESILGRVVFDRGPRYDPRTDSIVRVESQRLRKRLREYYDSEGANDSVLIGFQAGSYIPNFGYTGKKSAPAVPGDDVPAPRLNLHTIAVLPFDNLSSDPEQEYFCDGITEDIIHALSRIPGLTVIGRTSVFALKGTSLNARETGERLGAGTIVNGSVRRSGEQLRISSELCDAESGQVRWSDSFDRKLDDWFAVESEIAQSIARVLQLVLAQPVARRLIRGAPNMDAYLLYLRGRYQWNRMSTLGLESAIRIFTQATAQFPTYASPFAGLADAHSSLAMWGGAKPRDAFAKADQASRAALKLDPHLADAYTSAAAVMAFHRWQWEESAALAKRSSELEPSYSFGRQIYGVCLLAGGHPEQAHVQLEKAVALDPLSARAHRSLGWAYYLQRRFASAEKWLEAALEIHAEPAQTHYLVASVLLAQRRYSEALREAELSQTNPPDPLALGLLGVCLAHMDRPEEALETLAKLTKMSEEVYVDPLAIGRVHLALGESDRAVESIRQCLEERTPAVAFLGIDPEFDPLRTVPRFTELLAQLGN